MTRGATQPSSQFSGTPERYNLLLDPFISVRTGEQELLTLPQVLEKLARDEIVSFEALQPHQKHGWHAFTVQLAAILLHAHDQNDPAQPAECWRTWLREATFGDDAPWCLIADLKKPAFLQPPLEEGSLDGWKGPRIAPDDLDILVTSKNHDVKKNRVLHPTPEHWLYALLNLQTMQGYFGAGNYGIARMNGRYGNRPGIGLADGISLGGRFVGDVRALLTQRAGIVETFQFRAEGGQALIWTLPWDGTSSLALTECDPFFIEACRRARLQMAGDRIGVFSTSSNSERISSTAGLTGDAWTPIDREKDTALTVSESGFHYERVSRLLFDHEAVRPSAAMSTDVERIDPHLFAWALVRDFEGKPKGLHERILPIDGAAMDALKVSEARRALSDQAEWRINAVKDTKDEILKPALCALFQGGPNAKLDGPNAKLEFDDTRPNRWLEALDKDVDRVFFPHLFKTFRDEKEAAIQSWRREVLRLARKQLDHAMHGGPVFSQRRYRAEAAAESIFKANARKQFDIDLFKESPDAAPAQS